MQDTNTAIIAAEKVCKDLAEFYRSSDALTPKHPFTGDQKPVDLSFAIRALRSGDAINQIVLRLPEISESLSASRLDMIDAMRDLASSALKNDDNRFTDTSSARTAMEALVWNKQCVYSAEMVRVIYAANPPFQTIWRSLQQATVEMVRADCFEALSEMIKAVPGIEDDNDAATAINRATQCVLNMRNSTTDIAVSETLATLAYSLVKLDNECMGSSLEMSFDDFIRHEEKRFQQKGLSA